MIQLFNQYFYNEQWVDTTSIYNHLSLKTQSAASSFSLMVQEPQIYKEG